MKTYRSIVLVSSDTRSIELGAQEVFQAIQQELAVLVWKKKFL